MLGVQRVSPNEGENPRPRLLKIAVCSSPATTFLSIFPHRWTQGRRGSGLVFCSGRCLRWRQHDSVASTSANSKQHGDVLPHFREQRCLGFGMKLCLAACPVQAFKLVD